MQRLVPIVLAIAILAPACAHAAVTISSAPTSKMSCSGGVCSPTATDAVLNVGDLETLLAAGNVTVTTLGLRNRQADNIVVAAAFSWTTPASLTLDAFQSVAIDSSVAVNGAGGLTIVTDDGGTGGAFSVGTTGSVVFQNLSSPLAIDGAGYTLVNSVSALASAIAANPSGNFALAANYNASGDGTYAAPPITTTFTGTFEGLGNSISNVTIDVPYCCKIDIGFFEMLGVGGVIRDVGLANENLTTASYGFLVGLLVGGSSGTIVNSTSSGTINNTSGGNSGGLVGDNGGAVVGSRSSATIVLGSNGIGGGLVGYNSGSIDGSYATGGVSGTNVASGGLVGYAKAGSTINNSYATGAVGGALAGGLVSDNLGAIRTSYSTGAVTGGTGSMIGGLVGDDESNPGSLTATYWDMTSSGIANKTQGAGNVANDPGIKGRTTAQFQARLPKGFDRKVWAENPAINGGLPYLIANPPPQ